MPETIRLLEHERNAHGRKALQLKKKLKPMEGSADDDIKEIEAANQIRLRAISAIQHIEFPSALYLRFPSSSAFSLADRTVIGT